MPIEKIEEKENLSASFEFDSEILKVLQVKYKAYFDQYNKRMKKEFGKFFNAYLTPEMELGYYFKDLELRDDLLQNKIILDIGSSNIFFDDYCRQKYSSTVVALDINEDSLGKQHDLGVVADACTLPFLESSFDLIVSHNSIPYILGSEEAEDFNLVSTEEERKQKISENIFSAFRETYRVIKQGGQIRMNTSSEAEVLSHIEDRRRNDLKPFETEDSLQKFARIRLVKEILSIFERETGARCIFKDGKKGGLIIISKIN